MSSQNPLRKKSRYASQNLGVPRHARSSPGNSVKICEFPCNFRGKRNPAILKELLKNARRSLRNPRIPELRSTGNLGPGCRFPESRKTPGILQKTPRGVAKPHSPAFLESGRSGSASCNPRDSQNPQKSPEDSAEICKIPESRGSRIREIWVCARKSQNPTNPK